MTKLIRDQASARLPAPQMSPRRLRSQASNEAKVAYCKVEGCTHAPFLGGTGGLSKHMKSKHPGVKV